MTGVAGASPDRSTSTRHANGVDLGIETFGRPADPLVLMIGAPTRLSWPDGLCERLAAAGRHVLRYDLRDAGSSTTIDPERPAYDLRDLAADAAALVVAVGARTAHLAGIGVGGMVAQVAILDHPRAFDRLTLVGTRPVAPGPVDPDLPDHDGAAMARMFALPEPDWSDRAAVAEHAAACAPLLGNEPEQDRVRAGRIWDRTPSQDPAVHRANQQGTVFARLDCTPRWRERLPEIAVPALVVHGRRDRFFPLGNGEALTAAIPHARLLAEEGMGTTIPDAAVDRVAEAMLAPGSAA